ncbi:MAG: methionyl-tRNA formyltransferase [Epsilonproteobacteria bacterium]|nr:methionyl-tRNA formyltransferase [Campylobacterota bacterium]NPA56668.1 methionyl-tRNA formyltransferase [Campylobacterota bacterium]
MRVIFMGTPPYATRIMARIEDHLIALFTQPDRPVGRRQILTPPDTKRYILKRGLPIPIYQPETLKEEGVIQTIRELRPDFIVVAAYGEIVPREILEIAPSINLHASLLPKYRGASPIQQALLEGEKITGVTAILMNERLDSGDILGYTVTPIGEEETARELFETLALQAAELTERVLHNFDSLSPLPQHDADATYCKKITKGDGIVDFDDAERLYNRYRAFIIWPGVQLESGLKLKKMGLVQREGSHRKGEILEIGEEGVVVGCRRGAVRVERVQPPSKREMGALDYIRGRRLKIGDLLL